MVSSQIPGLNNGLLHSGLPKTVKLYMYVGAPILVGHTSIRTADFVTNAIVSVKINFSNKDT